MSAHEVAKTIIRDVLQQTGITATAGISSDLYLSKVAVNIEAKHIPAEEDEVRIAHLNEYHIVGIAGTELPVVPAGKYP